jgi:SAM-dependent methyltransferase
MVQLRDRRFWDKYWADLILPREMKRSQTNLYLNCILDVFDRMCLKNRNIAILEIGGAPGQYLAYMHHTFGYEVHCLDYSEVGCEKTRENFRLLNIPGRVHQGDVLDFGLDLPLFDIVYSLGFIEHFSDPDPVVARHVALLKPGGVLLIGLPNFLGINGFFLRRTCPEKMAGHNLAIMNMANWSTFEIALGLLPLFKGYVGGFEPSILRSWQEGSELPWVKVVTALNRCLHSRMKVLRRLNGRFISGYVMGVYKWPG